MKFVLTTTLIDSVIGHGHMTWPPPRDGSSMAHAGNCKLPNEPRDLTPEDGQCRWFNQGCQAGMSKCTDSFESDPCKLDGSCMEPTVRDPNARTWDYEGTLVDWTRYNPWRSPGWAPVLSPCGQAGGGPTYHPENGGLAPKGIPQGMDGRDLPELTNVTTVWEAGSVQDVAWSIHANHGGGYAYRLCPKDSDLSESCFQEHHLQFTNEISYIQYGDDAANRTAFEGYIVSEGTHPRGAEWKRNPIPACGDASGGEGCAETWGEAVPFCGPNPGDKNKSRGFVCTMPPMFEPPIPGLYGYGWSACFDGTGDGTYLCSDEERLAQEELFKFNVIDQVKIPADLPGGEYVLSLRWDCEQTPQIWAQCSDFTIKNRVQSAVVV
jgi:hypothetical protein